jgi:pyruvate formate lyase activating enzyme
MDHLNCNICELRCQLTEGGSGVCGLYELQENRIVERFADRYPVACPISIETAPVLHFYPGTKFLQITTTGCNFNCPGCISTTLVREMFPDSRALQRLSVSKSSPRLLKPGARASFF